MTAKESLVKEARELGLRVLIYRPVGRITRYEFTQDSQPYIISENLFTAKSMQGAKSFLSEYRDRRRDREESALS